MYWKYKDKDIKCLEDMPEGAVGFIYEIEDTFNNKLYIGKKILHHMRTLPPLKGKKRKRRKIVESDWMKYYGSNSEIKSLIKEGKQARFTRKILQFAFSKTELTYLETKLLFLRNVLEDDSYYNDNILGKFFKGNILNNGKSRDN